MCRKDDRICRAKALSPPVSRHPLLQIHSQFQLVASSEDVVKRQAPGNEATLITWYDWQAALIT